MKRFFGLLFLAVFLLSACGDALGDKYVSFAQCLADKDAVFYGAYWCPHCANQKKLFGKAAEQYLPYVECDPRGKNADPTLCKEKKIDGYPTWDFADESRLSGEIALSILANKTGCELPVDGAAEQQ